jgi:hypothetical protein
MSKSQRGLKFGLVSNGRETTLDDAVEGSTGKKLWSGGPTHDLGCGQRLLMKLTCKAVDSAHVENGLEMQLQKEMEFEVHEAQNW